MNQTFITVEEAERIILDHPLDTAIQSCPLNEATGRVLREEIFADRDLPPYHRVTMDGIAIRFSDFEEGIRDLEIQSAQGAGESPHTLSKKGKCIEIMTGAVLPEGADTIVRYEDLEITDQQVKIVAQKITRGQNIHFKGEDCMKGSALISPGKMIGPSEITVAASVGMTHLKVSVVPKMVILSSGDEIVAVSEKPQDHQIRSSNREMLFSLFQFVGIKAFHDHLPDDKNRVMSALEKYLGEQDVLILTGGVSKGKYDYISEALNELGVEKLFHGVKQRPGKPFYFGIHRSTDTRIFALPGNPVSGFVCALRYVIPWIGLSLRAEPEKKVCARLEEGLEFLPSLTCFLSVKAEFNDAGYLLARPIMGKGSGDFANLVKADGFLELPQEKQDFSKGDVYPIWLFRK